MSPRRIRAAWAETREHARQQGPERNDVGFQRLAIMPSSRSAAFDPKRTSAELVRQLVLQDRVLRQIPPFAAAIDNVPVDAFPPHADLFQKSN